MLRFYPFALLSLWFAVTAPAAVGVDRIELLDGKTIEGDVTAISTDGKISGAGIIDPIEIGDVRSLVRDDAGPAEPRGTISIELAGGGQLRAREITVADEKCQIAWGSDKTIEIPIDALRTVRFDTNPVIDSFQSAVDKPAAGFDRVFVKDGERVIQIPGLIDQLTADAVIFIRDDNQVRLPRTRLYGMILADVGNAPTAGARCRATLRDGSIIPGAISTLDGDVLSIQLSRTIDVSLSWKSVSRIDVQSPRLTYLSDMKPVEVFQQSIVSVNRPWQRDHSVTGEALQLRDSEGQARDPIEFQKGIGTHARCRLSYQIDGAYELFLAMVGIHAGTGGRGDCVVEVTADGKTIFSQRVTGQDNQLHALRLNVSGVQRLTIAVEPGNDLDLADHVDWCDARLIRKST